MKRRQFLKQGLGGAAGVMSTPLLSSPLSSLGQSRGDSSLSVLVVGTAQDGGIPHLGCSCRNCRRAWRNPGQARWIAGLAICDLSEKTYILIDATPDIRAQSALAHTRLGLNDQGRKIVPAGIFLTHAHIGHYTGLMFLGYESVNTHDLPLYASERMGRFLSENGPWNQLVTYKNIRLEGIKPGQEVRLSPRLSILPLAVPHREEFSDTLGFVIIGTRRRLLYIPDIQGWDVWDRSLEEELSKVDFALLDGTFYSAEELPGRDMTKLGHPLITQTLSRLGRLSGSEEPRIYFTHLNHSNPAVNPGSDARRRIESWGFGILSEGREFYL